MKEYNVEYYRIRYNEEKKKHMIASMPPYHLEDSENEELYKGEDYILKYSNSYDMSKSYDGYDTSQTLDDGYNMNNISYDTDGITVYRNDTTTDGSNIKWIKNYGQYEWVYVPYYEEPLGPEITIRTPDKNIIIKIDYEEAKELLKKLRKKRYRKFFYYYDNSQQRLYIFPMPRLKKTNDLSLSDVNMCNEWRNLNDDHFYCQDCPFFAECMYKKDKNYEWLYMHHDGYEKVDIKTFRSLYSDIIDILAREEEVAVIFWKQIS